ncbi:hypothetical protein FCV25MIE_00091 [Fagus crenata]
MVPPQIPSKPPHFLHWSASTPPRPSTRPHHHLLPPHFPIRTNHEVFGLPASIPGPRTQELMESSIPLLPSPLYTTAPIESTTKGSTPFALP